MPCDAEEEQVDVQARRAATATGPTRASDGVRMPPVSTTVWPARRLVEQLGDRDRVGDDGQVRDVAQMRWASA